MNADPATRGTVVLALTACAMQSDKQRAYAAGCDGRITKTINTRTFPDVIWRYLSAPASVGAPATSAHEDDPQAALVREIRHTFITDGRQQVAKL